MTTASEAAAAGAGPAATARAHMQGFIDWLHVRPSPLQLVKLLTAVLIFQLVWSGLGMAMVAWTGTGPAQANATLRWLVLEAPLLQAVLLIGAVVLAEEIGFRLLPLALALAIYQEWPRSTGWVVAVIAVVASVVFGLIHGSEWYRLALQAVGGLLYAVVFLKVCGMEGRYWKRAILITFGLHLAFNMTFVAGMRVAQVLS